VASVESSETIRINARRSDAFDVFNGRLFHGANPYLNTGAFVFDFALTGNTEPLPLSEYVAVVSDRYPNLKGDYDSYAHLFARVAVEVGKLDMDLHCDRCSVHPQLNFDQIAVEGIHARTSRAVVYCVWDWFESITKNRYFDLDDQIEVLQQLFRQSIYGGPTVYALLRKATEKGIPTFYLWEEGLMQYGYGKKLVRGVATTFDVDSHLDSDFTTRKDDCKAFLGALGFPVPKGDVVRTVEAAIAAADYIGYPVAVKPVVGHKGIGVTAAVQDAEELEAAFDRAVQAVPEEEPIRIIVERSITGKDYRILCVNGRFVAAMERCPAYIIGDGRSPIGELIDRENRSPARSDTPTSPLGKILKDEAMERYLREQDLDQDTVIEPDRKVFLRKVANLSAGGIGVDATPTVHQDNIILAQDIAQHFRLTCLGIDVIATDLAESWKTGKLGIIEINAAPGISMHLRPAIGEPVDVTARILESFFTTPASARIPIITLNYIDLPDLQEMIDHILSQHPEWTIGAVCQAGMFVNRSEKSLNREYNTNVLTLLRNPRLDLLIAEYPEAVLAKDGMFYTSSDLVVLDNPTETEMMLTRAVGEEATIVLKQASSVSIRHKGLVEQYSLGAEEPFSRVYLKELAIVLNRAG
jgi:cyanophycin synthetase